MNDPDLFARLIAVIAILLVLAIGVTLFAQGLKPGPWASQCFVTIGEMVDFLNRLPTQTSVHAKIVAVNSQRAWGQPYCVVYTK